MSRSQTYEAHHNERTASYARLIAWEWGKLL